jgi:hypothetical protein
VGTPKGRNMSIEVVASANVFYHQKLDCQKMCMWNDLYDLCILSMKWSNVRKQALWAVQRLFEPVGTWTIPLGEWR